MGLCHADIQMVPGRDLVQADGAVVVKVRVKAAGLERIEPAVIVEVFLPRIKKGTVLERRLDDAAWTRSRPGTIWMSA